MDTPLNTDILKLFKTRGYYKAYDIRIKLGDGKKSISMTLPDTGAKEKFVVFADPQKLKIIINSHYQEHNHFPYLRGKAEGSWESVRSARIDKRLEDSVPLPSPYFRGLNMPQMCFWLEERNICGSFDDGVNRSAWLIRQQAEFIPILTTEKAASLAYDLIGNGHEPLPAKTFFVPTDVEEACLKQFFLVDSFTEEHKIKKQQQNRRRDAITRLRKRCFAQHPLQESDFHL